MLVYDYTQPLREGGYIVKYQNVSDHATHTLSVNTGIMLGKNATQ